MIEKLLRLTASEIEARLATVADAFRLSDEDRTHFGAYADIALQAEEVLPQLDILFSESVQGFTSASLAESGRREAVSWVLVLPYEAFRDEERASRDVRVPPLVENLIARHYPATITVKDSVATLYAQSAEAAEKLEALLNLPATPSLNSAKLELLEIEEPEIHISRIEQALEKIRAGELYQVNLARRFIFAAQGTPLELFSSLGSPAAAPFSAALNSTDVGIISTSPELFLDLDPSGRIKTRPIKGTRPRSSDPEEDKRYRSDLDADEKERAELAMVIDIERNDRGKLAKTGSVVMSKPPQVVTYPTVHHREAEVTAQLKTGVTLSEVLRVMMPSGSVTGAPKISAMDCIAQTEAYRRGLYTGALGYLSASGRLRLSIAIRTLTLRDGRAHYFAGGGIVADSQPEMEVQETLWKAAQLGANLELSPK